MNARLNPLATDIGPKLIKNILAAHKTVAAALPHPTLELVNIRASQINGCGGCLDMHTKDAAANGETAVRLNLVAAWRDADVFTEAEKAALALTEEGTRLADGSGVTDQVWENAAKHYDAEQLMALVAQIGLINAFNRMNVITRQAGGSYTPGQFAHA